MYLTCPCLNVSEFFCLFATSSGLGEGYEVAFDV